MQLQTVPLLRRFRWAKRRRWPSFVVRGSVQAAAARVDPTAWQGRIWTLFSTANVTMVSPMVGARIPPELHHQLLEVAARLQVTPSEVLVAALKQYLERLQPPVNSPTVEEILCRLERLERQVEALEAASTTPHPGAAVATGNTTSAATQRDPVTLSSDLEALPVLELRRLARRVIGPGGDRDPFTGKHLRRAELLTALQRALGSYVSGAVPGVSVEGRIPSSGDDEVTNK